MPTTRFVSAGLRVCPVILLVCAVWSTPAYAQPNIDHPGIECIAPGKFAVILSGIDPDREVQTAKVYFRSSLYPDFYYVEMTYENDRFQGILPRPSPETTQIVYYLEASPETTQIIYYLEAIDGVFNGTRSLEWDPLVQECDDDPAAAYFTGEATGIVIGATTAGQSAIPAGFSAAGIAGTIAATGIGAGVGGGVGAGTAVVVGAVAASAAGAAVVTTGGEEQPTTTVVAAATTTLPAGPGSRAELDDGPGAGEHDDNRQHHHRPRHYDVHHRQHDDVYGWQLDHHQYRHDDDCNDDRRPSAAQRGLFHDSSFGRL